MIPFQSFHSIKILFLFPILISSLGFLEILSKEKERQISTSWYPHGNSQLQNQASIRFKMQFYLQNCEPSCLLLHLKLVQKSFWLYFTIFSLYASKKGGKLDLELFCFLSDYKNTTLQNVSTGNFASIMSILA